jgi:hypothetical protein
MEYDSDYGSVRRNVGAMNQLSQAFKLFIRWKIHGVVLLVVTESLKAKRYTGLCTRRRCLSKVWQVSVVQVLAPQ